MKEIIVKNYSDRYFVYIDNAMDKLPSIFFENKIKKQDGLFIITDSNVYKTYNKNITAFEKTMNCKTYYFQAGEKNKGIITIQQIYDFLIENNCNRKSVLIALGGGVVGDLVGFVASSYMRGIRYINIPTTLISQCDSCIGGKVGYNYKDIKNVIGSFYNPEFVFVSSIFLKTLSECQYLAGLGEVIKYGVIKDNGILNYIEQNYKQLKERENDRLQHIVKECLKIKSEVVAQDFKDQGLRNILNFGHTIGHGIETISNYNICHGEAVALGLLVAMKLSYNVFNYKDDTYDRLVRIYDRMGIPAKYAIQDYEEFFSIISHDKKNITGFNFVLIDVNGKCKTQIKVKKDEIIKALKESIDREQNN